MVVQMQNDGIRSYIGNHKIKEKTINADNSANIICDYSGGKIKIIPLSNIDFRTFYENWKSSKKYCKVFTDLTVRKMIDSKIYSFTLTLIGKLVWIDKLGNVVLYDEIQACSIEIQRRHIVATMVFDSFEKTFDSKSYTEQLILKEFEEKEKKV